jgi:hypothetical protein
VHILEVPAQVAALGKRLVTELTGKWSHASVLSKVISKIAALFEHAATPRILTLEEKLDSLGVGILNSDGLVPLLGDALKGLMLVPP